MLSEIKHHPNLTERWAIRGKIKYQKKKPWKELKYRFNEKWKWIN